MTNLYLAGPMTGYRDFNFPAFREAAARLREAGYSVLAPHEGEHNQDFTRPWEYYLRHDLKMLLECEGLALLQEWSNSRGARFEYHVATTLGMPAYDVDRWVAAVAATRRAV